ncbi:MAG: oligopeptide transporter, OPT family, partial [Salinisphaeraceae bacterium]|nr:oligopeptide transporter, OPT family [Salinisphaeraceae bacterium]
SSKLRFMGVGAMLVGGLWALWSMRNSLVQGLRHSAQLGSQKGVGLPRGVLLGLGISLAVAMWLVYRHLLDSGLAALPLTMIMLVAAFVFSAVAAYMAGLVGSSNNPVSGVTLATILLTALGLLLFFGEGDHVGPVAALLVGAVVCCAAAIGGDNMQDLKAGAILGATPWKQQVAQLIGVISAVFVLAPVLNLLLIAYGIGLPTAEHPEPLPAPQASLMAAVASGVFGGDLPWPLVGTGMLIAVAVIVVDEVLRRRGSAVRAPVLAVAVGIYLPMKYSIPIALGGVLAWVAARKTGQSSTAGPGILLAAGLITGEALMGILLAIPIVWSGQTNILSLVEGVSPVGAWPAILLFVALGLWFARILPEQQRP